VSDEHLGTMTGKYINAKTLRSMGIVKKVEKLESDFKESHIVSDLMIDFPPISKEDNPEVLVSYVTMHYERTGEIINYNSILDTQVGVPLRVSSKKRKSKKISSEVVDDAEPKPKKPKKVKIAPQLNVVEPALPSIQEEVADLQPVKILNKRTRGGTSEVAAPKPLTSTQKKVKRQSKEDKKVEGVNLHSTRRC